MSRTKPIDVARAWHRLCELAGRGFASKFSGDDVKDARRAAARKLHPDVAGGSTEKMQEANRLADELEKEIATRGASKFLGYERAYTTRSAEDLQQAMYEAMKEFRKRAQKPAEPGARSYTVGVDWANPGASQDAPRAGTVNVSRDDLRRLVLLARLGTLLRNRDEGSRLLFVRDRDLIDEFSIGERQALEEAMFSDVADRFRRARA